MVVKTLQNIAMSQGVYGLVLYNIVHTGRYRSDVIAVSNEALHWPIISIIVSHWSI